MRKKILPFVTTYHPALPNRKNILMSKWHLIQDQPLRREIYNDPPIISCKRAKSLGDILVTAELYRHVSHRDHELMSRVWPVDTFHKNIFLLDENVSNCKLLVSIKLGNFELWRRFAKSFFKRSHLSWVACDTFPHEDRDKKRYVIGRVSNGESGTKRFLKMGERCVTSKMAARETTFQRVQI